MTIQPIGVVLSPRVGPGTMEGSLTGAPTFLPLFPIVGVPDLSLLLRRQYWTNVIFSRDGSEQRRALRGKPRRTIEYVTSTGLENTFWRDYTRWLVKGQRLQSFAADISRQVDSVSYSVGVFTLDEIPYWAQAGVRLVLVDFDNHKFEISSIGSIVGNDIILGSISSYAWPNVTRIYAALLGWAAFDMDYDFNWFSFISPKITFNEDPAFSLLEPDQPVMATFNGREVITFPPNIVSPVMVTNNSGMEAIDYGLGAVTAFDILGYTRRVMQVTYTMREDDAATIRAMFDRMRGQQGEFYMPTFEPDLTPKTQANSGTNTLTIAGPEVYNVYNGSPVYKCVAVFMDDARHPTCQYNKISSIALTGGNDSRLTFVNNWTSNVTTDLKVSWMPVWRFATDIYEEQWVRDVDSDNPVINTKLALRMLEDL